MYRTILLLICIYQLVGNLQAYKTSRADVLRSIDPENPQEDRLSLDFCLMSSGQDSCSLAIDDETHQEGWSSQCAVSSSESLPWFVARLETPAFVTRVMIYALENIGDRGRDALTDFVLKADEAECARYQFDQSFINKTFSCDKYADHISVKSAVQDMAVLALCEVIVFGKYVKLDWTGTGEKALVPFSCDATTQAADHGCNKAMDEDTSQEAKPGSCFQTNTPERNQFLTVNMRRVVMVRHIKIFAAKTSLDSLENFRVDVEGKRCFKFDGQPKPSYEFSCQRFGKTITIEAYYEQPKQLTVCEVQITGFTVRRHNPPERKYLGCFKELKVHRDMTKLAAIVDITPERCETVCRRMQKPYFSLQLGSQCWCSERYGIHGRLPDDRCWMGCDKGNFHPCGAKLANSVFQIDGLAGKEARPD